LKQDFLDVPALISFHIVVPMPTRSLWADVVNAAKHRIFWRLLYNLRLSAWVKALVLHFPVLGSGLIDHSQKMTEAARHMAEKNV
jgi:hypothetical protein